MTGHPVLFVGAGPGDPELITVKGQRALAAADVIIYAGSLVPEAVLEWAGPETKTLNSAGMHLDEIIGEIRSAWEEKKRVVRLHTGDPSLYGAIFEQMMALERHGIDYRIIPGVTAAFAAAAAMGIEYTLPEVSQSLILTRMAGRTPVPEAEALERLAAHGTSMAIYLSISLIGKVAEILAGAYGPEAPVAVAYRVSQPDEMIRFTTVSQLVETVEEEHITRQALIIVGKVLGPRVGEGGMTEPSRLYDRRFSHGFRKAESDSVND
jgi:precorrin-4/cobalt-precorrin-4 C11-methyltransferase